MGIYTRYATAFLILFTSSAFSATRVPVKPSSETVITGARTGAISTPAGDVAFYGADKVYSFTAGDSVAPTVREVKSNVGSVSYPYGPGAAYPNDPTYSASAATKVKVKPVAVVPKRNIATGLKNLIKTNPAQIALGVATSAALAGVGWVMDEATKAPKKKLPDSDLLSGPGLGWCAEYSQNHSGGLCSSPAPTAEQAFQRMCDDYNASTGSTNCGNRQNDPVSFSGDSLAYKTQDGSRIAARRFGTCPVAWVDHACPAGTPVLVPVVESDFAAIDPWTNSQTASFLGDLLKEICKGSINPPSCYSSMEDRSKRTLQGPATAVGPWFTRTSTFPRPDGTTGTKTETTSTKFDITYGPEHFDVNPERKTTTTEDGQVTSETIETDNTPVEDVADTPDEEKQSEEQTYTFSDSDLPVVEPFYTQKYPDGFRGVWSSAKSDFDQSAFVSFLNSFVPSFSGSCPAFSMSFAIGSIANFGTHGFGNLCYALDFVKVCIMLGALFLCRSIVFGG